MYHFQRYAGLDSRLLLLHCMHEGTPAIQVHTSESDSPVGAPRATQDHLARVSDTGRCCTTYRLRDAHNNPDGECDFLPHARKLCYDVTCFGYEPSRTSVSTWVDVSRLRSENRDYHVYQVW
jgi:hypothetical protein